jgi:hypothetical protein
MPQKALKAVSYAIILWMIGFVWGSTVFMTPSLKAAPPIPFVSSNPWISFPILFIWLPAAYLLSKSYLQSVNNPCAEGLRLGLVFSVANLALDFLVLVFLFRAGFQYFASLTVLLGYSLLFFVPWSVGRSLKNTEPP